MLWEINLDFDKIKKGREVLSQSKTLKRINDMSAETFLRENMKQASKVENEGQASENGTE